MIVKRYNILNQFEMSEIQHCPKNVPTFTKRYNVYKTLHSLQNVTTFLEKKIVSELAKFRTH